MHGWVGACKCVYRDTLAGRPYANRSRGNGSEGYNAAKRFDNPHDAYELLMQENACPEISHVVRHPSGLGVQEVSLTRLFGQNDDRKSGFKI